MMRRVTPVLLIICPAAFGYIRSVTPDAQQIPQVRVDNTAIQFYLNSQVVAGALNPDGSNSTVITADSNPQQALRSAVATWNAAGSSANIHFLPVQATTAPSNPLDFQMTVAIGSTADFSAMNGSLAATLVTTVSQPVNVIGGQPFFCYFNCQYPAGGIVDTDIILNPTKTFSTTGAANTFDLQAVLTHELGHALGANHTGILGAVMFQYNTLAQRSLSTDDLALVNLVYPSTTGPVGFGTISGAVTGISGTALLTMVDATTGANTFGGITKGDGTFSVQVPAGTYKMYAEPLNGVVQPGNLYFNPQVTPAVLQSTLLGGTVSTDVFNIATVNIAAAGGASVFSVPNVGVTSVNGSASVPLQFGGPTSVASGQSVDLLLAGPGFDSSLSDTNFAVLGEGITVHAGGVRMDTSGITPGGYKILRVTLDLAAQTTLSLASIFVTKGPSTLSLSGALVVGPPTPTTTSASIVNSASGLGDGSGNGAVSPGGLYTIYDVPNNPNLGLNSSINNVGYDPYGFLVPTLGGISVTFDGVAAPIFFVDGAQINLQVPFEVAGKASTKVVVNYLGSLSTAVNVPVLSEQPALISANSSGKGPVAAVNQDGTINSAAHPAPQGTVVTIYGTGVGQQPGYTVFPTGQGAASVPGGFTGNYTYSIGGSAAAPATYVGPTPTAVGLAQFNVTIPTSNDPSPGGAVPVVVISPNGVSSQPGTTIYVQGAS